VDVVVSAHTHSFTDARLPNAGGRPVLVTQAFSGGAAFARIDLGLDPGTGDVAEASAGRSARSTSTRWRSTSRRRPNPSRPSSRGGSGAGDAHRRRVGVLERRPVV